MALNHWHNRDLFPAGFGEFFSPSPFLIQHPAFDLMHSFQNEPSFGLGELTRSSPGYVMEEVDDKYKIQVDVPGMKASDINVELEHEGSVLHISGERKITSENSVKEIRFDKRFTIGNNVESEKMSADLTDGVLTLTAPKKAETKPATRSITITEGNKEEEK